MAKAKELNNLIYCLIIVILVNIVAASDAPLLGGKKLVIVLPYKSGFTECVDVKLDPLTHKSLKATGYAIDIFHHTVDIISRYSGFNVSYEFQAFVDNETGQSAGTYDDLIQQVYKNKYDAAVGDISIVVNRSRYVDFTLPFVESGIRMLVRVGYGHHLDMWIFLQPFSWDLWLSVLAASALIGASLRFMERIHGDDDNHPQQQSTRISIIWLPIAQVVLPDRESVRKSCSKFVLVVWLILAFVLMQSYTASLSSILTLDQLRPTYPSVNDLKAKGDNVGYPTDSFVFDMLVDNLKFQNSKLKNISTIQDYKKALDRGTLNGGVSAIFDEIPYIRMFLKKYGSSRYQMVGPRYRTDGLGFAFPVNSNLTSYFSRAMLNVTQNNDFMEEIDQIYFGGSEYDDESESDALSSSNDPKSLTTLSFAGLFMFTGVATFLALVISESRVWRNRVTLAKAYSQKFLLLSPPWTKSKPSMHVSTSVENAIELPNTIPESPLRFSDSHLAFQDNIARIGF